MAAVRTSTIPTAITIGLLLATLPVRGHAETYTGTLGTTTVEPEPTLTIAVGPMLGVPIGEHAFENKAGPGLFVAGTARIVDNFSFVARYSTNTMPSQQTVTAVDRRATTLDAGVRYSIATPSAVRMMASAMAGKHFSTPQTGLISTESGFGFHLEVGAVYVLHRTIAAVGSVGYSFAWTERQRDMLTVDYSFELIDFSLGIQARL